MWRIPFWKNNFGGAARSLQILLLLFLCVSWHLRFLFQGAALVLCPHAQKDESSWEILSLWETSDYCVKLYEYPAPVPQVRTLRCHLHSSIMAASSWSQTLQESAWDHTFAWLPTCSCLISPVPCQFPFISYLQMDPSFRVCSEHLNCDMLPGFHSSLLMPCLHPFSELGLRENWI